MEPSLACGFDAHSLLHSRTGGRARFIALASKARGRHWTVGSNPALSATLPGWRNWQPRELEVLMVVKTVQVRSLSRAPSWPSGRNWQTRRTQNPLSARTCGFESHLGHHLSVLSDAPLQPATRPLSAGLDTPRLALLASWPRAFTTAWPCRPAGWQASRERAQAFRLTNDETWTMVYTAPQGGQTNRLRVRTGLERTAPTLPVEVWTSWEPFYGGERYRPACDTSLPQAGDLSLAPSSNRGKNSNGNRQMNVMSHRGVPEGEVALAA